MALDIERNSQFLPGALGDVDRVSKIVDVLQEKGKFIASQPRDGISGPDAVGQLATDHDEKLIADGMTVAVVDDLEPVQVEEKDCVVGGALPSLRRGDDVLEPVHEKRPVREARQRIMEGIIPVLL